jgi:putative ABC transport system ATP-binding protein
MNATTAATVDPVQLSQVVYAWGRASSAVLDIPELTIRQRETLFVKGPSGSGKSTLLSLLGGVVAAQSGEVRLLGTSLSDLSSAARDRFRVDHIGFVFQLFNLLPYLSLIDNVVLPCRFSRLRRKRAMRRSGDAHAEAARLLTHLGLDPARFSNRPVAELSVGQQQRVAAARALIGQPELIVADEPTSALDAERRSVFLELLFEEVAAADSTLVFVSHDPGLQRYFDRTVDLPALNRAHPEPE